MRLVAQFLSLTLSLLLITPLPAQTVETLQVSASEEAAGGELSVLIRDAAGAPVSDVAVVFHLPEDGPIGLFSDGTRAAVAYTDNSGRAVVGGITWNASAGKSTIQIMATRGGVHGAATVDHLIGGLVVPPAPVAIVAAPPAVPSPQTAPQQPGAPAAKPLPEPARAGSLPRVTITAPPANEKLHSGGGKKWILVVALAAGAGVGAAFALKGKSASSSSSSNTSSGISIGNPTVSVGHP